MEGVSAQERARCKGYCSRHLGVIPQNRLGREQGRLSSALEGQRFRDIQEESAPLSDALEVDLGDFDEGEVRLIRVGSVGGEKVVAQRLRRG